MIKEEGKSLSHCYPCCIQGRLEKKNKTQTILNQEMQGPELNCDTPASSSRFGEEDYSHIPCHMV